MPMTPTEAGFHLAMTQIYERAKNETGYVPSRFLQMVTESGGVAAARQLLHGPPSEGFTVLWEKQRLDLAVEFHMLFPEFAELFTDEERAKARSRLEDHDMDVDLALMRRTVPGES